MGERVELPRAERCDTCRFWMDEKDGSGWCRRYPPNVYRSYDVSDDTGHPASWWHPATLPVQWCGEYQPATVTRPAYTTSVPFQKLLDLLSTRSANCIESEGTGSWEQLFADHKNHPKGHDQPDEYRNFGEKTYLEMLLAMATLGVKAPSRWGIPKHVKSEFVKAGGEFFDGEYRPATVAPPPPAGG